MQNLDRAIQLVKDRYSSCYGKNITIEQYVFGWSKSFLVITTSDGRMPFKVCEFDNVNVVKSVGHFDSRVDAFKFMSDKWISLFK